MVLCLQSIDVFPKLPVVFESTPKLSERYKTMMSTFHDFQLPKLVHCTQNPLDWRAIVREPLLVLLRIV